MATEPEKELGFRRSSTMRGREMCKLYYKLGDSFWPLGSFPNREKAEAFWNLIRERIYNELGVTEPVYVEDRKK